MELNLYYFLLVFSATVVFIAVNHFRPKHKHSRPPGPLALPIIGHLHLLKEPIHQSLLRLAKRYGPVLLLRFGSRPVLVVSSPAAVEQCLSIHDAIFASRPRTLSATIFGYNNTALVFALYGRHWRFLRRFTALHVTLPSRPPPISSHLHSLLYTLYSDTCGSFDFTKIDLNSRISNLSLNIIMEVIAGKRNTDPEKRSRFRATVEEAFALSGSACAEDFIPLARWAGLGGAARRMAALAKEMDEMFQELIDQKREAGKWKDSDIGREEKSMIETMLALQQKEPEYTDVVIKGMILSLITAGNETSSGTIKWAMALLLNHPEALKKAKAEIDENVSHGRLVTESDIPNLRYLNSIIRETLRLFPAGGLLPPHESSEDCTVAGFDVPRGTILLVNTYALQRDPSLWGNPLEFKPERFEDGEGGGGYNYIPFGVGRRRCPGESTALRVTAVTLGSLIQCFEWRRVGVEPVDLSEGSGLNLPMANPLEAMFRAYPNMISVLSQL